MTASPTLVSSKKRISTDTFMVITLGVLVVLFFFITPLPATDLWWNLALGRALWGAGTFPATFVGAEDRTFGTGWLAQAFLYLVYIAGGYALALTLTACLAAVAYLLLVRVCFLRSGELRLSTDIVLTTALPFTIGFLSVHPPTLVLPLFSALLLILAGKHRHKMPKFWLLPILLAVWVNSDDSFWIGLITLGAACLGELLTSIGALGRWNNSPNAPTLQRSNALTLLTWTLLAFAATALNPQGVEIWATAGQSLVAPIEIQSLVRDWQPLSTRTLIGMLFVGYLALVFTLLIYSPRRLALRDLVVLIPLLSLAFMSMRHIVWAMFGLTPIVCVHLAALLHSFRSPNDAPNKRAQANPFVMGCLMLALVVTSPWTRPLWGMSDDPRDQTATKSMYDAALLLEKAPYKPARLLHDPFTGSYLAWAEPGQTLFLYPRFGSFAPTVINDAAHLHNGLYIDTLLQKYNFDAALVHTTDEPDLVNYLSHLPNWRMQAQRNDMVYLTRCDGVCTP